MSNGKKVKTISEREKYRMGINSRTWIPWDESKEALKNMTISSWTQFYHKPYQTDWQQAHDKAVNRKWKYIE